MASIKTVNTPVGTIYEVNGKAYKDKTKADAALAALNQQQENKQIQQAEQNLDRDLQFAEENQGKANGTDAKASDHHSTELHCGKCEPQPARLGKLFLLPQFKSGDEQSQNPRGRPAADSLDGASQGEGP